MISRTLHRLHFFPRFAPSTLFPRFPRFTLFFALCTGCTFFCAWHRPAPVCASFTLCTSSSDWLILLVGCYQIASRYFKEKQPTKRHSFEEPTNSQRQYYKKYCTNWRGRIFKLLIMDKRILVVEETWICNTCVSSFSDGNNRAILERDVRRGVWACLTTS